MNRKIIGLLTASLMATSVAANATETLVFSDGTFSGDVILGTPLPRNGTDISVSPIQFNFPEIGWGVSYDFICPSCGYSLGGAEEFGGATLEFSTRHGRITSWDINIDYTGTPGTASETSLYATISNHVDTYTLQQSGVACTAPPGAPNPCPPIIDTISQRGSWSATRAPEIDPASAASGLTLLLGGLAVMRGRSKTPVNAG